MITRYRRLLAAAPLIVMFSSQRLVADDSAGPAATKHFTQAVLPLLKTHCFECHSHEADAAEGGLVLDSRAGWKIGGDSGPAIVPGLPNRSRLFTAVRYTDTDLQMPPDGKLSQQDIATLERWIADGAYDPRVGTVQRKPKHATSEPTTSTLWSLKPVVPVSVPNVPDNNWIRNDIDRFILAKQTETGIRPNGEADQFALLRRATFDLTGLPPTLDEIAQFINDKSDDVYERLVDRLLDSPHYGERWGRHWLDVARYGDSNGGDINYAHANAWRYRDYVVKAFNEDKPYDEFIREQLAGDLLTASSDEQRREFLTATGFLMLGPKMLAEVDTDKLLIDIVDEQLDITGLAFLGMTFGCARCHDHKFDPITTEDYYAMAGIFRSTQIIDVLRPSNGVSEWLERDVTPSDVVATIDRFGKEREGLERQLAELGVTTTSRKKTNNTADKAIVVTGLPTMKSTTWSAWVRIEKPQNLGAIVSASYQGVNQGHSLGFDHGQTPRIVWNHGAKPHTIIAAAKPISLGDWHHLALTFDATTKRLALFVDGAVAASTSNIETTAFSTIGVGRRESSQEFQLVGDVDEIKVFDSALSDTEVRGLFERQSPDVQPLLAWSFDGERSEFETPKLKMRWIGVSTKSNGIEDGVVGSALAFDDSQVSQTLTSDEEMQVAKLRKRLQELERITPRRQVVMAVAADTPVNLPVHIRGNHLNLGEAPVDRTTPQAFAHAIEPIRVAANENGRLQLANWIANPKNPLTARVIVNRIWQHHFGAGLVRSSSNFGERGELPSHPKLFDWLASEFIASGWSVKHMHRLIMNSATYRMSSRHSPSASELDPENRLLSRYPVRRLEAEAIRDSLLAVTGELDRAIGGTLLDLPNKQRVKLSPVDSVYERKRRAVYLPSIRVRGYEMFSIFDVSSNGQHVARRPQTMVAQQALFLMNNPMVVGVADRLATTVSKQSLGFDEQVDRLHLTLYGRHAAAAEVATLKPAFQELALNAANAKPNSRSGLQARPSDLFVEPGAPTYDISATRIQSPNEDAQFGDDEAKRFAWQQIIHTMICANEFIHIR